MYSLFKGKDHYLKNRYAVTSVFYMKTLNALHLSPDFFTKFHGNTFGVRRDSVKFYIGYNGNNLIF